MTVRIYSNFHREAWEGTVEGAWGAAPTLEDVFRLFNRVTDEDAERLERWGYHLPSLSVGDLVTIDGRTFSVEPVGFKEVTG